MSKETLPKNYVKTAKYDFRKLIFFCHFENSGFKALKLLTNI